MKAREKTVAGYIAGLTDWRGPATGALCDLVRQTAPGAEEAIKWAQPVFSLSGPFCFVRAHKRHVNIGFWRGRELTDPHGLLQGSGDKMAHVKIASLDDIRSDALAELIAEAAQLNRDKGDPTRR